MTKEHDDEMNIQQEIERVARQPVQQYAEPDNSKARPNGIDDLGRMSAEAVMAQYEAAAKAVEEMGVAVKERISKISAALIECDADMKEIAETANSIREKGKLVQAQIEEASALSSSIRDACVDFKKRVGIDT